MFGALPWGGQYQASAMRKPLYQASYVDVDKSAAAPFQMFIARPAIETESQQVTNGPGADSTTSLQQLDQGRQTSESMTTPGGEPGDEPAGGEKKTSGLVVYGILGAAVLVGGILIYAKTRKKKKR